MLEMTGAKFWAEWGWYRTQTVTFWKMWFGGYLSCISLESMGLWVKSGWYRRSGLVVRSSAHNPKPQVRFPPPPLWDPTSVLVGGAPSGDHFSPKSPSWKWEIVDFLDFNEKYYFLMIIEGLALCAGSSLCASRQRTLRGLFFTKKSVLMLKSNNYPGNV